MASNDPISGQHPLAVLIDADNTTPSKIGGLLAEIAKYGVASVKRIYGDWTKPNLGGWKDELLNHSIQPVQQFAYTKGKNATDIAMIIDAMDLLYTQRFRGFCLVTSDSDFTPLAARIREQGLIVYGFGEEKTPAPFRNACDKFVFLHLLETPDDDDGAAPPERKSTKELRQDGKLIRLVDDAIASSSDDSDWATLSHVGQYMNKQSPEFDPRNYGYGKLSALIDAIGLYETDRSRGNHPAIRRKARK
ncbi:MAG: NYN domain-containing protein [Akkermansiaceae bacterium]|nr:NYN domain-containing protein [Akkermansiaceae bacterium]MCP5545640.1 NYN domain-containing protein [Akkermansiaceae bacterium]